MQCGCPFSVLADIWAGFSGAGKVGTTDIRDCAIIVVRKGRKEPTRGGGNGKEYNHGMGGARENHSAGGMGEGWADG